MATRELSQGSLTALQGQKPLNPGVSEWLLKKRSMTPQKLCLMPTTLQTMNLKKRPEGGEKKTNKTHN